MDFPLYQIAQPETGYPKILLQINNPPRLLYYRGSVDGLNGPCVAVVGTRKMTAYGAVVTEQITKKLAAAGVTIISGLAYGVDATAHKATLEMNGTTIGILGSGLADKDIYPPGNQRLAQQILKGGGGLISEYPSGMPAFRYNFLARNRIIAGLSLGTLVMECPEKSGALITAKYALDYNRAVYAVPGPITSPQSSGTNRLIKEGATAIMNATDILDDLHLQPRADSTVTKKLSDMEQKIIDCLRTKPCRIDAIIEQTNFPAAAVLAALTFLEMHGIIKQLDSHYYIFNSL